MLREATDMQFVDDCACIRNAKGLVADPVEIILRDPATPLLRAVDGRSTPSVFAPQCLGIGVKELLA
ncbi:MAG TPA: hypothetical protein VKM54_09195, partial [Myxococcota bacterium]|nr:hypothetical protein [Myxococcota bacterium]